MASIAFTFRRIRLLLWKNLLMRRRHYIITAFEIVLPTLLAILLVYIRTKVDLGDQYVQFPPDENGETGFPIVFEDSMINDFVDLYECRNQTEDWYGPLDCIIAFSPDNTLTSQLIDTLIDLIQEAVPDAEYMSKGFANERELELYQQSLNIPTPGEERRDVLKAGIVFEADSVLDANSGRIGYKIRTSSYFETKDIFPTFQEPGPHYYNYEQYNWRFTGLQILLDKVLIGHFTGVGMEGVSRFHINSQAMPYPKYPAFDFNQIYQFIMPQFVVQGFIFMVPSIVRAVVAEKETGIKELMKMMGLPNWIHWVGWLINSLLVLIISVTITVVLYFVQFSSESGAVLVYSDPTLWWVVLFMYTISASAWCFFVSAFFQKPTLAMTVGIILWIALYQPVQILLEPRYADLSLADKMGACLLPNMCVHFALLIMCGFEAKGEGARWGNVAQSLSSNDSLTVAHVLGMFVVNTVLYVALAMYVENVMPTEYGVRKPWYYIFQPSTWFTKQQQGAVGASNGEESTWAKQRLENGFEAEPEGLQVGIDIQKLRKVFNGGSKVAVDNVTVKMYHGQITALLGHNGAGKTTTISMITGMYAPTSGKAFVNGYEIGADLVKVRENLGLCPQHNMLFGRLTVMEHFLFFGRLKGLTDAAVRAEAKTLLRQLQLEEKKNQPSMSLSGGQKRKLSLGCALIGGSRVVVLDEPTSGMDPEARRAIWDLLLELRAERTILLTTHYMEEADVLGDRIAIMSDGRLKCCGSAMFLKKFYGAGYTLKMTLNRGADKERILQCVRHHIPDAFYKDQQQHQRSNESDPEVAVVLPVGNTAGASSLFVPLFKELSHGVNKDDIQTVGLSLTTMDEVFVRVGELDHVKSTGDTSSTDSRSLESSDAILDSHPVRVTGLSLLFQQFKGLLLKRILYTSRKWRHFTAQLLIPVALLIAAILVSNISYNNNTSMPALPIRFGDYKKPVTLYRASDAATGRALDAVAAKLGAGGSEVGYTGNLTRQLLDVGHSDVGRYRDSYVVAVESEDFNLTAMASTIPFHSNPLSINLVTNTLLQRLLAEAGRPEGMTLHVTNHPLQNSIWDELDKARPDPSFADTVGLLFSAILPVGLGLLAATYIIFAVEERKCKAKQLQLMTGCSPITYWGATFLWDYFMMLIVICLMIACFPICQVHGTFTANGGAGVAFLILAVFGFGAIAFSYLFSLFVGSVPGGFALVSIIHIFMGLVNLIIRALNGSDMQTPREAIRWIARLFPSFGAGACSYHYAKISATNSVCKLLSREVKELICVPDFYYGTEYQGCCDNCEELGADCFKPTPYLEWDKEIWGDQPNDPRIVQELVYMVVMGVVYLLILLAIELGLFTRLKALIFAQKQESFSTNVQDADVLAEVARVNQMVANRTEASDAIVVQNLSKSYGASFAAVSNLSFGVHHGECFGLLGVNGAGKTTTFRMLTGDEVRAAGNAWAAGNTLDGNRRGFLSTIGYCPQFDGIIGVLHGREMLQLFCRLRGVPPSRVDAEVEKWLRKTGLAEAARVQCQNYSGGMKRRLSAAMAMVADPPVLFLDEPTSGVDPVARRQFWQVIRSIRNAGQAIVLTSHSMEECEALCTRLGIMVNGELQCLGGVEHLKKKFAQGYSLTIKLKQLGVHLEAVDPLIREISGRFSPCALKEQHQNMLQFQVYNTEMSLDVVFQRMEEIKSRYTDTLEEYSVNGTTLEEVFLTFARKQYVDGRTANVSAFKKFITCQCFSATR